MNVFAVLCQQLLKPLNDVILYVCSIDYPEEGTTAHAVLDDPVGWKSINTNESVRKIHEGGALQDLLQHMFPHYTPISNETYLRIRANDGVTAAHCDYLFYINSTNVFSKYHDTSLNDPNVINLVNSPFDFESTDKRACTICQKQCTQFVPSTTSSTSKSQAKSSTSKIALQCVSCDACVHCHCHNNTIKNPDHRFKLNTTRDYQCDTCVKQLPDTLYTCWICLVSVQIQLTTWSIIGND
jgi:hypothetical protein